MKTLNTILKGILLWSTALITIFIIMAIDSLYECNTLWFFMLFIIFDIIAILANIAFLTIGDFKALSGYNLYMRILNNIDK